MGYHQFKDENGDEYGSFEVFQVVEEDSIADEGEPLEPGYYWWACFPGCLSDGDPVGPFDTEDEAIRDAQDG